MKKRKSKVVKDAVKFACIFAILINDNTFLKNCLTGGKKCQLK